MGGFLLSRSFFLPAGALGGLLPDKQNGTCHIDRRISPYNDSDHESKSKVVNNASPKNEKGEDDHQGSQRREERPAQSFVDAAIDDGLVRLSVVLAGVFSNAVKYDDGVIERIPYDCQ